MPSGANKKDLALKALNKRIKNNKGKKRIDNSDLPAGSPMYFYCISCGDLSDTKPESYTTPIKRLCSECQELKDLGWLN